MDYKKAHDRIISRARERVLAGYVEAHHILPRCLGGTNADSNLVDLTPEEHYVIHQLLVKMHPNALSLALAAMRMSRQCTGNKAFGWLRRRVAAARRGKPFSSTHRANLSRAQLGRVSPWKGKTRPVSTRLKMRSLTPQQEDDVRVMVAKGAKRKEVMLKYGIGRRTIYTILHRAPWDESQLQAA